MKRLQWNRHLSSREHFLNDEIIGNMAQIMMSDIYGSDCLVQHNQDYFISTQFYTALTSITVRNDIVRPYIVSGYEYSNVQRWTTRLPILNQDIFILRKLYIPVNISNIHWILITVDMRLNEIQLHDPMKGEYDNVLRNVEHYLIDEWEDKKGDDVIIPEWNFVGNNETFPTQSDSFNYGIYICLYAYFQMKNLPILFDESHLVKIRQHFVWSLLNNKLSF